MHTDIHTNDWVDRLLPELARPYARLMRLDRPIGTWLLLWPCLWGLAMAAQGWPDWRIVLLFAVGALVMRGAGCVINDLYDRHLDAQVERTASRPLASGALSVTQALVFLGGLLLIGLSILLQFNRFTQGLGLLSMAVVIVYPLAKRVTWWPQLVLGLAFNWGALMGWTAVYGSLAPAPFLLYASGIFWTLGYDTIYAHQDKRDDALIGIKSLALRLGDESRAWLAGFYSFSLILLTMAGYETGLGLGFYLVLPLAIVHATYQLVTWRMDDPANCLQRFRWNRDYGLIVFIAILCGWLLR